jgi:hypothetical protein
VALSATCSSVTTSGRRLDYIPAVQLELSEKSGVFPLTLPENRLGFRLLRTFDTDGEIIFVGSSMLTLRGFENLPNVNHADLTLRHQYHFPRKKKAAEPVKARSCPLAFSGLQKNGSRWLVPVCAFAPHASGMLASDQEDSKLYPTIFILWGVEPLCMTLLVNAS